MCAGAIYWAGIGRVVYGMTEKDLLAQTGSDPQNPTFDLSLIHILTGATVIDDSGQKVEIQVADTDIDQLKTGMAMDIGLQSAGTCLLYTSVSLTVLFRYFKP